MPNYHKKEEIQSFERDNAIKAFKKASDELSESAENDPTVQWFREKSFDLVNLLIEHLRAPSTPKPSLISHIISLANGVQSVAQANATARELNAKADVLMLENHQASEETASQQFTSFIETMQVWMKYIVELENREAANEDKTPVAGDKKADAVKSTELSDPEAKEPKEDLVGNPSKAGKDSVGGSARKKFGGLAGSNGEYQEVAAVATTNDTTAPFTPNKATSPVGDLKKEYVKSLKKADQFFDAFTQKMLIDADTQNKKATYDHEAQMQAEESRRIANSEAEESRRIANSEAEESRRIANSEAEESRRIANSEAEESRRIANSEAEESRRMEIQASAKKHADDIAMINLTNDKFCRLFEMRLKAWSVVPGLEGAEEAEGGEDTEQEIELKPIGMEGVGSSQSLCAG